MSTILICSSPIYGHLRPMLGMGQLLISHGHDVHVLTGAKYRALVTEIGATFIPLPQSADFDDHAIARTHPQRSNLHGLRGILFDARSIFITPLAGQYRAARDAVRRLQPQIVFAESMFAGMSGLALLDPAVRPMLVTVGVTPLILPSSDTAPFGLGLQPCAGRLGRIRNRVLAAVIERALVGPIKREVRAVLEAETGVKADIEAEDCVDMVDAYLQCTVPAFEYPHGDLPAHVQFVGPVPVELGGLTPTPAWWADLHCATRVVHVTQGTLANDDFDRLIRPTMLALASSDVLVVVSTGGRPIENLGALPSNVRAAAHLDYDALLPHVDLMITNGGYGGVQQALAHGIPVIVSGRTEDKMEVGARVSWVGAGINLRSDRPSSRRIRRAVRRVFSTDSYHEAAGRLAAELRESRRATVLERALLDLVEHGQSDPASSARPLIDSLR